MPVTIQQISAKIKNESYLVLPDGRTTLCTLTLENGYTVHGTSACVDPTDFNMDIGRFHAFNKAMDEIWPLEGYLLAQFIYENTPKTQEEPKEEPKNEWSASITENKIVAKQRKKRTVSKASDETIKTDAPFGYKQDGTPKKAPGRPRKEQA